jgi:hypothetical protein
MTEQLSKYFDQLKIRDFFDNLFLLRHDLQLLIDGWKFHFAIDYYQILRFTFPMLDLVEAYKDKKFADMEKFEFAVNRATTSMAFDNFEMGGPPILLPSYSMELKGWMNKHQFTSLYPKERKSIINLIGEMKNTFFNKKDKLSIDRIFKQFEKNSSENLTPELVEIGRNIVLYNYVNLLFLMGGSIQNTLEAIGNLFRLKPPKLTTPAEQFPQLIKDFNAYMVKTDFDNTSWYNILRAVPHRESKWRSNRYDAMAVDNVFWLNNYFKKHGKKEIVLLISDAESMYMALNWDKLERNGKFQGDPDRQKDEEKFKKKIKDIDNKKKGVLRIDTENVHRNHRILRNSGNFFLFMLMKDNSKKDLLRDTLRNVNKTIDLYYKLIPYRDVELFKCKEYAGSEECPSCGKFPGCKFRVEIDKIDNNLSQFRDQLDIVRLFNEKKSYFSSFLVQVDKETSNLNQTVTRMIQLVKSEKIEDAFFEKEKELKRDLENLTSQSRAKALEEIPVELLMKMGRRLERLNGMPFRVEFTKPAIREILFQLDNMLFSDASIPIAQKKELIEKLLEYSNFKINQNDESRLLYAMLLFCFERYELVEQLIVNSLQEKQLENRKEFDYFHVILLEALFRKNPGKPELMMRALRIVDQLIDTDPNCAKYYHVRGKCIARGVEAGVSKALSFSKARADMERGLKILEETRTPDISLYTTLHNNLAFLRFLSKDYSPESLEKINAHISEMRKLERERWSPQFYDTEAMGLYLLAHYSDMDQEEKLKTIKESRLAIDKAFYLFGKFQVKVADQKSITQHRKIIQDYEVEILDNRYKASRNAPNL